MKRLVDLGFADQEPSASKEAWMIQVKWLQESMHCRKLVDKFEKLGKTSEARLKADLRSMTFYTCLKTLETLLSTGEQAKEAFQAGQEESRPAVELSAGFNIPNPIPDGLTCLSQSLTEKSLMFIEKLAACTQKKHHGETLWKASLAADAALKDILECASAMFGGLDMDPLDSILTSLQEDAWQPHFSFSSCSDVL